MKRAFAWLLALAMLILAVPVLAAEDVLTPHANLMGEERLGYVRWMSGPEGVKLLEASVREQIVEKDGIPPERIIHVQAWDPTTSDPDMFSGFLIRIPDDGPEAEAYYGRSVRFLLEASSFAEGHPVVTPVLLELFGMASEGEIVEIAEDYLVVSSRYDNGRQLRLAITADTHLAGALPVGGDCEFLYDAETMTLLQMHEAHG